MIATVGAFVAIAVLLGIGLSAWLLPQVMSPRARARRGWRRVHAELARANDLSDDEAKLLWRIGVGAGLENPALLFVRPVLFATRAAQAGLPPEVADAIRRKIYGR